MEMQSVPRGGFQTSLSQAYFGHKKTQVINNWWGNRRKSSDDDEEAANLQDQFLDEYDPAPPKDTLEPSRTCFSAVVLMAASAMIALNALSMVFVGSILSYVSGGFASVVGIAVVVAQLKLENLETLRTVLNGIREDVNRFMRENVRLTKSVDELQVQATALRQFEERLQSLTQTQGQSSQALVRLVKDSKETLTHMKRVIRYDIISELMDVVMKGENDESGTFSDREIQRLCVYMKGLPAVQVNEELLRQALDKDRSIYALMTLIMDIAESGIQEGDNIFVIDETSDQLQQHVLDRVA